MLNHDSTSDFRGLRAFFFDVMWFFSLGRSSSRVENVPCISESGVDFTFVCAVLVAQNTNAGMVVFYINICICRC